MALNISFGFGSRREFPIRRDDENYADKDDTKEREGAMKRRNKGRE